MTRKVAVGLAGHKTEHSVSLFVVFLGGGGSGFLWFGVRGDNAVMTSACKAQT